jgi:hypothetical protein
VSLITAKARYRVFVPAEQRVMRSWMWNTIGAAVLLGSAAVCGVVFVSLDGTQGTAGASLLVLAGAVVLVLGTIRVLTMGVIVTEDGLVVRELFRTRRLPWDQLRRTDVVLSDGVRLGLYGPTVKVVHNPRIFYRDSTGEPLRTVTVTSLGAYRREVAQSRADDINELIRRHRPDGTGRSPVPSVIEPGRRRREKWRRP